MSLPNDNIGDKTREVLAAQAHIWNHAFSFINSMSLKCAIQLGISDIIHSHGRAMTLSDLVNALPVNNNKAKHQDWDDARFNCLFNEVMASDARLIISVMVEHYLPHVVEGLEGSKNLNYVGGDMFKFVPSVDAIVLKSILLDWGDEEYIKILKKCKEVIPSKENGGKVIIIDIVILDNQKGDNKSYETKFFFDMLMMAVTSGKQRSQQQRAKLFSNAGFSDYNIISILELRSVVEVYP
ncbi:hypothetical protein HAX54_042741 [Datura stramonium]|uniref:Uncharacterized protein n=1 Tax=Datura stramonium TaxID=4076 RepID=A0ABS8SMF3_DATST|nr:hypothetical protein [Datura stramonium]